jgi:hypothetical protein
MKVSYYRVAFPSGNSLNIYECAISYYLKKYSLETSLPVPRAKQYLNGELVACLPGSIAEAFADILRQEEGCRVSFMKTEETMIDDFTDMYVSELYSKVNGINTLEHFLVKRV